MVIKIIILNRKVETRPPNIKSDPRMKDYLKGLNYEVSFKKFSVSPNSRFANNQTITVRHMANNDNVHSRS